LNSGFKVGLSLNPRYKINGAPTIARIIYLNDNFFLFSKMMNPRTIRGIINHTALFRPTNPINKRPTINNQSYLRKVLLFLIQRNINPNIGRIEAAAPPCEVTEPTRLSLGPIISNLINERKTCTQRRKYITFSTFPLNFKSFLNFRRIRRIEYNIKYLEYWLKMIVK
jgi:hypothetical protein